MAILQMIDTGDEKLAAEYLAALRANWPSFGSQPVPYIGLKRAAAIVGADSWEQIKWEMYRLERQGKIRCVFSSGLDQVWLRGED